MGYRERKDLLQDVADLLHYAHEPGYQNREDGLRIFSRIAQQLEAVTDDVEESADNLEERFPDRANELRDKWSWAEEAKDKAEEIASTLEEEEEEAYDVDVELNELEGLIEELPRTSRKLPSLDELAGPRAELPVRKKREGIDPGERVFLELKTKENRTFPHIRQMYHQGLLSQPEYIAVLTFIGRLLEKADLGEYDYFFGHETTVSDIQNLYEQSGLPVIWLTRSMALVRSRSDLIL